MIRITLSRKLGELRITQSELSAATGIRQNTINDLYHDVAERVSLEQLDKICEALNCSLSEIMEFSPNAIQTTVKCKSQTVYKNRKA
ncbi:MAG: helix-turn-helix transcriptional regulator [Firmicutes bacterium]|nr:helix-turn-helix transcriptional regulator [[Eubacterium] siraeum]MCM1488637.1 helix-turn-helix transcriptional regulator [Bacillota bacterium]